MTSSITIPENKPLAETRLRPDTSGPLVRTNNGLQKGDYNLLIANNERSTSVVIDTVDDAPETIALSLSVRQTNTTLLHGRFTLDIRTAEEAGLIDRELRSAYPRIRIERIGSRYYLKRAGDTRNRLELPAQDNLIRVKMKHAYRWGFRRQSA